MNAKPGEGNIIGINDAYLTVPIGKLPRGMTKEEIAEEKVVEGIADELET